MGSNNVANLLQLFAALGSPNEREVEDAYYQLKDFLSKPGNSQYIVANEVLPPSEFHLSLSFLFRLYKI